MDRHISRSTSLLVVLLASRVLSGRGPVDRDPPIPARPAAPSAQAVEQAIERGRKDLRRRLEANLARSFEDYPLGRIAFPLAALLKAGEPASSPVVVRALEMLEGLPLEKTYCAATYLFALDAFLEGNGTASGAGSSVGAGGSPLPFDPARARRRLAEAVDRLIEWQSNAHGSWTYAKGAAKDARHDFSNTQFAVLGLAIGRKHGIDVPREVFTRIADLFAGSITLEGGPAEHELTPVLGPEHRLGSSRPPRLRIRSGPGGWGYRDPRKGGARARTKKAAREDEGDGEAFGNAPYASMTAAGASSLVIALDALRSVHPPGKRAAPKAPAPKAKAPGPPLDEPVVIARAERALHASYAWISSRFDAYVAEGRHLFYTLYSLEKVGDLGRIERFSGRDWYAEGAALILRKQRADGGWGTYIDTSFALLFLARATRILDARSAPAIYTGKDSGGRGDLVYIAKLDGFLSAGAVLEHLGETRKPELVELGEEVVKHYAPDRREELAPALVRLWTKPDAVTSFARKALADVTGIEPLERGACESFVKDLEAVKRVEETSELAPEMLAGLLTETRSPRLKSRIADLARRRDLRALTGRLVDEMSHPCEEYRVKVHGILTLWTGQAIPAARRGDSRGWDAVAEAWKVWWSRNGAGQAEETESSPRRHGDTDGRKADSPLPPAPSPGPQRAGLQDRGAPRVRERVMRPKLSRRRSSRG